MSSDFRTTRSLPEIGLRLKLKHHNYVKLVQINDSHCRIALQQKNEIG